MSRPDPCPFCETEGSRRNSHFYTTSGDYWMIECLECHCQGPWGKTDVEAIALWNKRYGPAADPPTTHY